MRGFKFHLHFKSNSSFVYLLKSSFKFSLSNFKFIAHLFSVVARNKVEGLRGVYLKILFVLIDPLGDQKYF